MRVISAPDATTAVCRWSAHRSGWRPSSKPIERNNSDSGGGCERSDATRLSDAERIKSIQQVAADRVAGVPRCRGRKATGDYGKNETIDQRLHYFKQERQVFNRPGGVAGQRPHRYFDILSRRGMYITGWAGYLAWFHSAIRIVAESGAILDRLAVHRTSSRTSERMVTLGAEAHDGGWQCLLKSDGCWPERPILGEGKYNSNSWVSGLESSRYFGAERSDPTGTTLYGL